MKRFFVILWRKKRKKINSVWWSVCRYDFRQKQCLMRPKQSTHESEKSERMDQMRWGKKQLSVANRRRRKRWSILSGMSLRKKKKQKGSSLCQAMPNQSNNNSSSTTTTINIPPTTHCIYANLNIRSRGTYLLVENEHVEITINKSTKWHWIPHTVTIRYEKHSRSTGNIIQ